MNTAYPAFEIMTPALVGSTITLRSPNAKATGLLTGVYAEGRTTRGYDGTVLAQTVSVTARFDRNGDDWDVPVTPDMTLEVHP